MEVNSTIPVSEVVCRRERGGCLQWRQSSLLDSLPELDQPHSLAAAGMQTCLIGYLFLYLKQNTLYFALDSAAHGLYLSFLT